MHTHTALHSDYYVSESNNVNWLKIHCCTPHAGKCTAYLSVEYVHSILAPCGWMLAAAGVPAAMPTDTHQNRIKFMHTN